MILNVNAGFPPQNNGKITTAFNNTSSESVADQTAKAGFNPSKIGTPEALTINHNPQAGWKKLYAASLQGTAFAGYASSIEEQPATTTKKTGKNSLWKQIIKEAARGSGISASKPSAGGDAFAKGYATDLSSSSSEDAS